MGDAPIIVIEQKFLLLLRPARVQKEALAFCSLLKKEPKNFRFLGRDDRGGLCRPGS
jgi:hypothetical protein